jgi:DNA polymerase V
MYHDNIPQQGVAIHTGFPNPGIDASLKDLDLNQLLITHSAATYLMRIVGDAWQPLGIFDGDIAIIDRAVSAQHNDIVVWWHDGDFMLSHLHQMPKTAAMWGVITSTIHRFKVVSK